MAILAASVCTRGGKVLLSRQFQELSAQRIQELFSRFPKLAQASSQHTTVEDDGVRYVYEPLEELYVIVITDLHSNILQDIKTLRLVARVVSAYVQGDERQVGEHAFELISAFDEIVSLGYSENLTPTQVETFLEMESHEEKIQEIIERNKELEAAEERKKKARQLEQQRRAARNAGPSYDPNTFSDGSSSPFTQPPASNIPYDSRTGGLTSKPVGGSAPAPASRFAERKGPSSRGKGLQLGKKKATREEVPLLAELDQHESGEHSTPRAAAAAAAAPAPVVERDGNEVTLAESLSIEASRDGTIKEARVSGTLHLYAASPSESHLRINTVASGPAGSYKTNPKMDRALFAKDGSLALRNASEAFPQANVLLVKWTVNNVDVPIVFNMWIDETQDAGFMRVILDYELSPSFTGTLENVAVTIPLPTSNAHVQDFANVWDQFDDHIVWMIPEINSSNTDQQRSTSFEFTAEAESEEDFFPMEVAFAAKDLEKTFGEIDVQSIVTVADETPIEFKKSASVQVESYIIR